MSAEYVDDEVTRRRRNPSNGGSVLVAIGVRENPDTLKDEIGSLGGSVIKELPFRTLRVEIPEDRLDALCRLQGVESVEYEREISTFDSGNSRSPTGSSQ